MIARGKDYTRLPVPNLLLCHWSSQLFDLRTLSPTDAPVLLLNQLIMDVGRRVIKSLVIGLTYVTTSFG